MDFSPIFWRGGGKCSCVIQRRAVSEQRVPELRFELGLGLGLLRPVLAVGRMREVAGGDRGLWP